MGTIPRDKVTSLCWNNKTNSRQRTVPNTVDGFIALLNQPAMRRIKSVNDDGSIRLLWADNQKAVNITVQTTARGQVQTLKVCDFIRPLLDA